MDDIERLQKRVAKLERRARLLLLLLIFIAGAIAAAVLVPRAAAQEKKPDDGILRVRGLAVIDANGVERVRIGAPVPEPLVLGKRVKRDGNLSGIILYDGDGNERSGYCTGDDYGNVIFTEDSLGEQHVLFMTEPGGGTMLGLWDMKRGGVRITAGDGSGRLRISRAGEIVTDLPEVKK